MSKPLILGILVYYVTPMVVAGFLGFIVGSYL